jgi:hypothetical protein
LGVPAAALAGLVGVVASCFFAADVRRGVVGSSGPFGDAMVLLSKRLVSRAFPCDHERREDEGAPRREEGEEGAGRPMCGDYSDRYDKPFVLGKMHPVGDGYDCSNLSVPKPLHVKDITKVSHKKCTNRDLSNGRNKLQTDV